MKANIFKSLFKMAAIMTVFVILFSCEERDEIITIGLSDQPALDVDKRYLSFAIGDNTKEVMVYYQDAWNYKVDEDWVHATREGSKLTV